MALSSNIARDSYKNLSIEELEKRYENMKRNYCFHTKDEQIEYIINNYRFDKPEITIDDYKKALEKLLKEKTGSSYKLKPQKFKIKLKDMINFITKHGNPCLANIFMNFLEKLKYTPEYRKRKFVLEMLNSKMFLDEFSKEAMQDNINANLIFKKYQKNLNNYRDVCKGRVY